MRILWQKLRQWTRSLKSHLMTLWFSRKHPETPLVAKVSAIVVVAYALSPIDLIPDFIPIIGYLDDMIIVPIGVYITLRLVPEHVLADSRVKAEAWLASNQARPKNYFVAFLFVCVWIAAAWWAWEWFVER